MKELVIFSWVLAFLIIAFAYVRHLINERKNDNNKSNTNHN